MKLDINFSQVVKVLAILFFIREELTFFLYTYINGEIGVSDLLTGIFSSLPYVLPYFFINFLITGLLISHLFQSYITKSKKLTMIILILFGLSFIDLSVFVGMFNNSEWINLLMRFALYSSSVLALFILIKENHLLAKLEKEIEELKGKEPQV
jgi:hypothetical protein